MIKKDKPRCQSAPQKSLNRPTGFHQIYIASASFLMLTDIPVMLLFDPKNFYQLGDILVIGMSDVRYSGHEARKIEWLMYSEPGLDPDYTIVGLSPPLISDSMVAYNYLDSLKNND